MDRRILERRRFIGKQKQTCKRRIIDLPTYQSRGRWVPPTLTTVGAMGTQKGKNRKFPYILRSSGPRPAGAHRYYTNSEAPGFAHIHRRSTHADPFLTRGKMSQILAQITTQIIFGPLELRHYIGNQKQTKRPMIVLSSHQKWDSSAPNSENRWRNGYVKRVKVQNFLYIDRSPGPRRVQCRQCHTTCWGHSCYKTTTVPYIPMRPYISQVGAKIRSPTKVNLGNRATHK